MNPLDPDSLDRQIDVLAEQTDHFDLPEKHERKPQQRITLLHVTGAAGLLLVMPLVSGPVFELLGMT